MLTDQLPTCKVKLLEEAQLAHQDRKILAIPILSSFICELSVDQLRLFCGDSVVDASFDPLFL